MKYLIKENKDVWCDDYFGEFNYTAQGYRTKREAHRAIKRFMKENGEENVYERER